MHNLQLLHKPKSKPKVNVEASMSQTKQRSPLPKRHDKLAVAIRLRSYFKVQNPRQSLSFTDPFIFQLRDLGQSRYNNQSVPNSSRSRRWIKNNQQLIISNRYLEWKAVNMIASLNNKHCGHYKGTRSHVIQNGEKTNTGNQCAT